MNKEIPKKTAKRFKKFKNFNLPASFYDKERNVSDYAYYDKNNKLCYSSNLLDPFKEIINIEFYYTCHSKYFIEDNNEIIIEEGFYFSDSFEEIIELLYDFPESFKLLDDDKRKYNEQQIQFLTRLKNYLLLIGLKDLKNNKIPLDRYKNKLQEKYKDAHIIKFQNKILKDFINKKYNFDYRKFILDRQIINKEDNFKALLVDEDENFRLYIRFLDSEVKKYKEIKNIINDEKLKDEDEVVLRYFEILEIFK